MTSNTKATVNWSRPEIIALALIVVAAALLRLVNLNYMEFKGDEAENLYSAGQIFHHHLPLVGIPSSIGTDNPPLFDYFLILPLLLSRNPVLSAGWVAFLNAAAVGLTYVFCRRFFTRRIAWMASLLFATNPWAVFYSRKIWQQDVLPIVVVGFFFCLFAAVFEKRPRALIGAFACFAAMTQFHMSSMFYALVMAVLIVWQRPKIHWRYYAVGVLVVVAIYLPYLIYDIQNHGRNLQLYLHPRTSSPSIKPDALTWPFTLATTRNFFHYFDLPVLDGIVIVLIIAGAFYTLAPWRQTKFVACGLWLLIPVVCLLFNKVDLVPHYFIALYPIQFILIAIVVSALTDWLQTKVTAAAFLPFCVAGVIAVYQTQSSIKFLAAIREEPNVAWMEYGPPYQVRLAEVENIAAHGITEPMQVQAVLLREKSQSEAFKYDYGATRYLVENVAAVSQH